MCHMCVYEACVIAYEASGRLPARIDPLPANRSRPFFFRMKLVPMNALELTASERPM